MPSATRVCTLSSPISHWALYLVIISSSVAGDPIPPDQPKRVLILMADTGGGHRASAQALKAGFQHFYGPRFKASDPPWSIAYGLKVDQANSSH